MTRTNKYFLTKKFFKFAERFFSFFIISALIYIAYSLEASTIQEEIFSGSGKFSFDYDISENAIADDPNADDLDPRTIVSPNHARIEFTDYDYRARVLDLYFKKNGSPLYKHGGDFVAACDRYKAPSECTLLPAIAKVETDLCKTGISASQFNCWGYGGSGSNRIVYPNFETAIEQITKNLINGYSVRFFQDPEYGELTYCGAHCDKWGDHVKSAQVQIRQFAKSLGYRL